MIKVINKRSLIKRSSILNLFLILTLNLSFLSCASDEDGIYIRDNMGFQDISLSYTTMEYEILDLVNDYRISLGLSNLNTINLISEQAIEHTTYMINKGEASHDNFSSRHQILTQIIAAKTVGENVAYGYISAESVVNAWIKSEGHRRNIENKEYTDFGISTKQDENGRYYFTHIFIKR